MTIHSLTSLIKNHVMITQYIQQSTPTSFYKQRNCSVLIQSFLKRGTWLVLTHAVVIVVIGIPTSLDTRRWFRTFQAKLVILAHLKEGEIPVLMHLPVELCVYLIVVV